ncbi:helix-turn-helix transcriptional regulator [Bengtsoniella intestinalis]|uniref:helix-turn-helix domain-containing protein n=1 Tax=Bengtsoniella intestinalis TaxID=3073143 RepID=UPI00391F1239
MCEYTAFGTRLRIIRKELGLSQEDFATLVGSSKQTLSRYETFQRAPSIALLHRFATKVGVSLSYFMGETPLSLQSYRLAIAFDASPPEVQENIWNILRTKNSDKPAM